MHFLYYKQSSFFIVTLQFLYHKMVQLLYSHSAVSILQKVQFLYCQCKFPIPQNGPVTVLSQCSPFTTKRPSFCIVTEQFLYYKTFQLLYCQSSFPLLQNGPVILL